MSEQNVESVRRGYQRLRETGQFPADTVQPDFAWDVSDYDGWTEQPIYARAERAQRFPEDWTAVWDDWEIEIEELHDVGDKVLAIAHQRGRSKRSEMRVEDSMGHVWTLREVKGTRLEIYPIRAKPSKPSARSGRRCRRRDHDDSWSSPTTDEMGSVSAYF